VLIVWAEQGHLVATFRQFWGIYLLGLGFLSVSAQTYLSLLEQTKGHRIEQARTRAKLT